MDERLRVAYLTLLGLPGNDPGHAQKAALERAHALRKFEIENYWKRSAYFWGFQLVSFGALVLAAKDGMFDPPFVLIVAVLGAVAALTGILTARGSKFWQKNWEAHVDFLAPPIEGNLHATVLVDGEIQFSVSRVNERFLELLCAGWIAAFVSAAAVLVFPGLLDLPSGIAHALQIGMPSTMLVAGTVHLVRGQRSQLGGRAYRKDDLAPIV